MTREARDHNDLNQIIYNDLGKCLSTRTANCLCNEGLNTIDNIREAVRNRTYNEWLRIPNFGRKSYLDLVEVFDAPPAPAGAAPAAEAVPAAPALPPAGDDAWRAAMAAVSTMHNHRVAMLADAIAPAQVAALATQLVGRLAEMAAAEPEEAHDG